MWLGWVHEIRPTTPLERSKCLLNVCSILPVRTAVQAPASRRVRVRTAGQGAASLQAAARVRGLVVRPHPLEGYDQLRQLGEHDDPKDVLSEEVDTQQEINDDEP